MKDKIFMFCLMFVVRLFPILALSIPVLTGLGVYSFYPVPGVALLTGLVVLLLPPWWLLVLVSVGLWAHIEDWNLKL